LEVAQARALEAPRTRVGRTDAFGLDARAPSGQDLVVSIVESFKKLVDPVRARQEQEERRSDRERPDADDEGGPPPPKRRCRVCGHEGPESRFCPDCLAETMRPL